MGQEAASRIHRLAGNEEQLLRAQTHLLELIAGGSPLEATLAFLCHTIETEIDGALCSILILDGDRLRTGAAPSLPSAYMAALDGTRIGPGLGSCGNAAFTGITTIVEDIETHPFWVSFRELARQHGLRSCWSSPIRAADGAIIGTFALYRREPSVPSPREVDLIATMTHIAGISIERRRLDDSLSRRTAELESADRQKDLFLAMLAHELRNPLAPIRIALEIMQRRPDDAAAIRRSVSVIDRQVGHLSFLVSDLLDLARISCGRIDLHREPTGLDRIIDEALEVARPTFEAHRHRVSIQCPHPAPRVDVDRARLVQVVTNLLHNAAKYTPAAGEITVSVRTEGTEAILAVGDTGVGLTPEAAAKAFDLFYQADRSLARSQGGLGIGLTMVKRLVELHGGAVSAASAGLDRGSEFTVRLPLVFLPLPIAPRLIQTPPRPCAKGESVVVVDDNADAAEMLALALSSEGFEVRVASDGPSALALCFERRPSMVLLDIGLPGIDGYEVARQLRRRFADDPPRVITLSGYGQPADRKAALAAGADVALVKPVDLDVVLGALRGTGTGGLSA